jgi:hypothetical protein
MDKVSFFVFHIFINSLLAFFTVALLVEGIIFLYRFCMFKNHKKREKIISVNVMQEVYYKTC